MADTPKPSRTPDSARDAGRHFRNGCLFLIGTVIVLWICLWIAWTLWPR